MICFKYIIRNFDNFTFPGNHRFKNMFKLQNIVEDVNSIFIDRITEYFGFYENDHEKIFFTKDPDC